MRKRVDYARGTFHNPMTPQELQAKFRGLASQSLPGEQVEAIINLIDELEDVTDIRNLVSLLVSPDCEE